MLVTISRYGSSEAKDRSFGTCMAPDRVTPGEFMHALYIAETQQPFVALILSCLLVVL